MPLKHHEEPIAQISQLIAETDLKDVMYNWVLKDCDKQFIMYQLLEAIHFVHAHDVIHRDIKVQCVFLIIFIVYIVKKIIFHR